jgi:erythromycin esterase
MIGPRTLTLLGVSSVLACAHPPVDHDAASKAAPGSGPTQWLATHAVTLATLDPGHGFSDLAQFGTMVGTARVVGLGEANHGAHEFFRLKHRLVEFLVAQRGFNVFALEADHAPCDEMNDYVLRGIGDPANILANVIGAIPWDTEEVLSLILWLRQWNADPAHPRKVQFFGFDAQNPVIAIQHVIAYLKQVDPVSSASFEPRLAALAGYKALFAYGALETVKRRDTQDALNELLDRFDASRERWIAGSSPERWLRVRQELRTAQQAEALMQDPDQRDRFMADNIGWLLEQQPDARIAAWAHNGHLGFDEPKTMGGLLKARLGPGFFNVAMAFDHGVFRARRAEAAAGEGWRAFSVGPAPQGSLELEFAAVRRPRMIVDLRVAPAQGYLY